MNPEIRNEQNGGSERHNHTKAAPWKWIGLVVLLVGLLIAVRILPVTHWLTEFNQWIAHLGIWGI